MKVHYNFMLTEIESDILIYGNKSDYAQCTYQLIYDPYITLHNIFTKGMGMQIS